jgi:hypothetical protein
MQKKYGEILCGTFSVNSFAAQSGLSNAMSTTVGTNIVLDCFATCVWNDVGFWLIAVLLGLERLVSEHLLSLTSA